MTKPRSESGTVTVSVDFFAAMMSAPLTDRARLVLAEAVLQSCGPEHRRQLPLDPASIEMYTGLHRNNARRGLKELVDLGILVLASPGVYRLVREYTTWRLETGDSGPRRYAESALARFPSAANTSTVTPIQRDSPISGHPNPGGLTTGGSSQSPWIGPDAYAYTFVADESPDPTMPSVESLAGDHVPVCARSPAELNSNSREIQAKAAAATRAPTHEGHDPKLLEAGREVRRAFGDAAAATVWNQRARIGAAIGGRWECYTEAVRQAERELAEPGAEPIRNLPAFLLVVAKARVAKLGTGQLAAIPAPGQALGQSARTSTKPRYRETGPPPPPFRPPLSPERLAEHQRGNQPRAKVTSPGHPIDGRESILHVIAKYRDDARRGASPRDEHPPEILTGT